MGWWNEQRGFKITIIGHYQINISEIVLKISL